MSFASVGLGFARLLGFAVQPDPQENSANDQELLNRINSGNHRAVPAESQQRQQPAGQQASARPAGDAAAQPAGQAVQTPDAEQLRNQRLAHFEQQAQAGR